MPMGLQFPVTASYLLESEMPIGRGENIALALECVLCKHVFGSQLNSPLSQNPTPGPTQKPVLGLIIY
ncbi:hypothetical protein FKM82_016742 [Ascaphus truei]